MRNLECLSDLSVVRRRGCISRAFFYDAPANDFCEIIHQILKARAPVHIKLALFHPFFDPIKAHIHGFCAFLFYCAIAISCGSGIVRLHWCGGLFMP
jgi:hypothetical protein